MDYFSIFEDSSRDEKIRNLTKYFKHLALDPELLKNTKTDQQLIEKIVSFLDNNS